MKKRKMKKLLKAFDDAVNDLMDEDYNHSSKKRRKKYRRTVGDDGSTQYICNKGTDPPACHSEQLPEQDDIPKPLSNKPSDSFFFLGHPPDDEPNTYVGMRQGSEGNILITGGNGSCKSAGIAKPTLCTWQGALCVTDIKGELSSYYRILYQQGFVKRPFKIFNPMEPGSISYDFFYWVAHDSSENVINNIREITLAIIPTPIDDRDRFWIESEQSILTAALIYYFNLGISFIDAILLLTSSTVTQLGEIISKSEDTQAKMFLGEVLNQKPEQIACFDRGIRNKLLAFSTDPHLINALRGDQNNTNSFTWEALDEYNIFLCIPADKIEQWDRVINLLYTQLIRHLERRPDKYDPEGVNNVQVLLLMDEFARFGKLEMITHAVATLRSKNVNICLIIQSLAQLDKIYGEFDRRIILDNCQYKAFLRADDADTQEYICKIIGTHIGTQRGFSDTYDKYLNHNAHTEQVTETREYIVYPNELSTLNDILLLTPYGFYRVDKLLLNNNLSDNPLLPALAKINTTACRITPFSNRKNIIRAYATPLSEAIVNPPGIHIKVLDCIPLGNGTSKET